MPPRKHIRPGSAVPSREIPDEEALTPPPISVEDVDQLGDDTTPPPLKNQLKMLASGLEQVWSSRNDAERLGRIEHQQHTINKDLSEISALLREFVMPALKASQGRIDLLLQHHEANKVRVEMFYEREWPAAVKSLDGMTERLGRVERSLERNESDMRGMGERFNAAHSALGDKVDLIAADLATHTIRLNAIETTNRDRSVESTAVAKRDKLWFAGLAALAGFIAGNVRAIVEFFNR